MKPIRKQNEFTADKSAHTAGADNCKGAGILPQNIKKFKDVETLCKAYTRLEAEFTRRCQLLGKLEGELKALKSKSEDDCKKDETIDNGLIGQDLGDYKENSDANIDQSQSQNSTQVVKTTEGIIPMPKSSDSVHIKTPEDIDTEVKSDIHIDADFKDEWLLSSEGNTASGILEFFNQFPDAAKYIGDIVKNLGVEKISKEGLLTSYIKVLKDDLSVTNPLKSRLLSDYNEQEKLLNDIYLSSKTKLITGGEIPLSPPIRPKTIAEAGTLAKDIIKIR